MSHDRRSLLLIGGAALAATFAPGAARALSVEEMDVPRQRLLLSACETQNAHARVVADLMREIEGKGIDAEHARAQVAAMSCPFCGCRFDLASLSLPPEGDAPKF